MSKQVILLFAALFLIFASNAFAITPEAAQIAKLLKERTNGNDAFYNKLLAPAKSLDLDKNAADRIQTVNDQTTREIDMVVTAFKTASEDKKMEVVSQAVGKIEPEVTKADGAYITFVDQNPSAATARTFVLIPKKNASVTVASVTNILTSYKRSAKTSDFVFEYENAKDITSGSIKQTVGTETSWMLPEAATPFAISQNYALKKCRQLLGWRCVTSLYRADAYLKSADAFQTVFVAVVDLDNNPDHADFAKDKRSKNQISGSTAVYIIKESANWVLIYGTDVQWNNDKLSFTSVIQKEFAKDFARFKSRIASDLKLSTSDLK